MISCNSRAGKTVQQGTGYLAFIPGAVPPAPPISFDTAMIQLLSSADLALGKLSGIAALLPNPDLFVAMYVKKEAVLSSQIEGIDCTLDEVIAQEEGHAGVQTKAIGEVVNYVNAMNYGMERLKSLPLCLRLIREVHSHLMSGVRGDNKDPGEFRKTQNWIGPQRCTLATATFVPPPVPDMNQALSNLELFLHDRTSLPLTIQCAIIHAQFETIHPFLDGNGRVGRLLVALLLHERSVLKQPLLYMSLYLKLNRREYYDHLMAVRTTGDWEGWIKFFLIGLEAVSNEASSTAQKIVAFREDAMRRASEYGQYEIKLLDVLFVHPILDIRAAEQHLACTYATAATAMKNLETEGYVTEITGQKRNKRFKFTGYLKYFDEKASA